MSGRSGWTCIVTSVEVAIAEGGRARSAGRVATTPEQLELFAQSLAPTDRVVMEATGNALAIARILEPHVAEVVLAHAKQVRAISHARVKTDKVDAKVLADLLAAGLIPKVWIGDDRNRDDAPARSRAAAGWSSAARRSRTRSRPRCRATSAAAPPVTDLFGKQGRAWLAEQQLPIDERLTVDGVPAPAGLPRRASSRRSTRCIAQQALAATRRPAADDDSRSRRCHGLDAGRGRSATSADSRAAASWSAISGCTRRSASPATAPRVTAACPRTARLPPATCSSRLPGRRRRARDRCAPSRSAPPPAADGTSRPSPSRASSPCSPGTCSPAARTTPSSAPASSGARSAASSSPPARRAPSPARTPTPSGTRATDAAEKRLADPSRDRLPTPRHRLAGHAAEEWVRARHRSAHLKGPRRARPRGRPQAPDACTSPRQSPAPNGSIPQGARTRQRSLTFIRRSGSDGTWFRPPRR